MDLEQAKRNFTLCKNSETASMLGYKAKQYGNSDLLREAISLLIEEEFKKVYSPAIVMRDDKLAWPLNWTQFILNLKEKPWRDLLSRANARRKNRLLFSDHIAFLIKNHYQSLRKRGPLSYSWTCGGTVPNSYSYQANTTVVLFVVKSGYATLGIAEGPAQSATPGRIWKDLQPFYQGHNHPSMLEKISNWALTGRRTRNTPYLLKKDGDLLK